MIVLEIIAFMITIGLVLSIITLFMVVMVDIIEWLKDKIKEK